MRSHKTKGSDTSSPKSPSRLGRNVPSQDSGGQPSLGPPAADTTPNQAKRRYTLFLKILQKVNMVFLVVFVCYFAWTISASYSSNHNAGLKGANNESKWYNNSILQLDDFSGTSANIPFVPSADDNQTELPYHMNIIIPSHRKRGNRRRKKGRNKKRNKRLKKKQSSLDREDYLNLTIEPRKTKNDKKLCKGCKVRKRKGRNKFNFGGLNPTILRKILERVAQDTLSGVRSGTGTIRSLQNGSRLGPDSIAETSGWSINQHWDEAGEGRTVDADNQVHIDGKFSNGVKEQWSSWTVCSSTCGVGQQERMRECGSACKEVESMVCISPKCEGGSGEDTEAITEFYKWEGDDFVPPLFNPKMEHLDPNIDVCDKWVSCNKNYAQDFLQNSTLPACPCQFPLQRLQNKQIRDNVLDKFIVWVDTSSHSDLVYKPDAAACMRSQLFRGTSTLAVQQCCYDNVGLLVTRGRAAGTPHLISPEISQELHYKVDLLPWIVCKGDWTRYNQVLPPNNDLSCPSNPDDLIFAQQIQDVTNF